MMRKICAAAALLLLNAAPMQVCAEEPAPEMVTLTVENRTVCFHGVLSGHVTVSSTGSYLSEFSDEEYNFTPESDGIYVVSLIIPNKEMECIKVESYLVTAAEDGVDAVLYDIDADAEPDSEEWESVYYARINAALQSDYYFTAHTQGFNLLTDEPYTETELMILTEPNSGTTVHIADASGMKMKQFFTADSPDNLLTDTVKGKYIAYRITADQYADEPVPDGTVTVVKENAKLCGMLGLEIKDGAIVPGSYPAPRKMLRGDCDLDGNRTLADLVLLQKYLLGDDNLTCWHGADLNGDRHINAKDLSLMKQMLRRLSAIGKETSYV